MPLQHGVLSNDHAEVALASSVLDDLREDGRRSVVTAYHWVRELLTGEAFDPWLHRDAACPAQGVTGARWYWQDPYPDDHLLADAESLRRQHDPDFMLVHPMGLDHAGHVHGGESTGYRAAARRLDTWLTRALPRWHAAGFDVLLTSDHGMNADGWHGGDLPSEREVPLWWWPLGMGLTTLLALELNVALYTLPNWVGFAVLLPVAAVVLLWLGRHVVKVTATKAATPMATLAIVRMARPGCWRASRRPRRR